MKLCDRCQVSGCCLTYLGNACKSARKRVCPDVALNNAEAIASMEIGELADFLAGWISNIWVDVAITSTEVQEWLMDDYEENKNG